MDLSDLLAGLKRAPWYSVGRPLLVRAGMDIRSGYLKTVAAILKSPPDQSAIDSLTEALTEYTVCGEKFVQFVKLLPGERAALETWINSKRAFTNDLTAAYPGAAPESIVVTFQNQDPSSTGNATLKRGIAAVFTAARSFIHSDPIPASNLIPSAAAGYEKIVGYKKVFVQTYDAIWLPPSGDMVVLAIDYPGDGPKRDFPLPSAAYLQKVLRQRLGRPLKLANFWHAVDGLYLASGGKLVDYGFSVGGQSVNHHRARRKVAPCLRKAVYDAGGAAAVQAAGKTLELFKVAMQWSIKHKDGVVADPEVLIPGVAKDLNKPMPKVDHCVVRGCLTTGDLGFVVSKLTPHIKNWI